MLQYVSKIAWFVMLLCQDRGQTMANTDDSANFINNARRCARRLRRRPNGAGR
jgi:hypothetical protein